MSNLMPEGEREWPAHLEPIKGDYGPLPNVSREPRIRTPQPIAEWRDRPKFRKSLGFRLNSGASGSILVSEADGRPSHGSPGRRGASPLRPPANSGRG